MATAWEAIQSRPVDEIEAEVFEQMAHRSNSDTLSPWADLALALCERIRAAEGDRDGWIATASAQADLHAKAADECAALRARAERAEETLREIVTDTRWAEDMHRDDAKALRYALVMTRQRARYALELAAPPRTVAGQVTGKDADATAPVGPDLLKPDADQSEVVAAFFAERSR